MPNLLTNPNQEKGLFPKILSSQNAYDIAKVILEGFEKHYALFRQASLKAKSEFEKANWHGIQQLQRERITYYDQRVTETTHYLQDEYDIEALEDDIWPQIKLHYMGLLTNCFQPELAETFFNSVCCRILPYGFYNNRYIFLRPTLATEYLDIDPELTEPTFRVFYPKNREGLPQALREMVLSCQLQQHFEDLSRDIDWVCQCFDSVNELQRMAQNVQIQALSTLFYRNKTAYLVGRIVNGRSMIPFVIPIIYNENKQLILDTVLLNPDHIETIFSFARSYFLVDMAVPASYVGFLKSLLPMMPLSEIYTSLGLQKHGKNLFYRDFLMQLQNSTDEFVLADGIPGMVMLVFTLKSYPYVFKLIRDQFPPQKETTREQVQQKYLLVKNHDRVGRMADTLEFSNVVFPLHRFSAELLAQLQSSASSSVVVKGDQLLIKHLYIERRMIPLNIWIQEASDQEVEHAVIEFGNAIKELMMANIFPGDMLYKNFGMTRHGRVVFYDYDEVEYLTDMNIRHVPPARNEEEEMSGEVWYSVGAQDIFPETYRTFLLGDARVRKYFLQHHPDFFDPAMWLFYQNKVKEGKLGNFFPYPQNIRFSERFRNSVSSEPNSSSQSVVSLDLISEV